ncbi:MAG: DNA polymerase III subunit beta [Clostridia bacterium]|nr:DNA polymerase III subunit beta [Oscillospiraceae bacterium]MBR4893263.1 DNA polymerase III subunit beta [Clostridia bacterium]
MKFTCEKHTLLENINVVLKAVSSKSAAPILEGILIKATEDGNIKLLGNDLKIAIESNLEGEVIEAGSIVLNAKILYEIVSKLPEGIVSVSSDDSFKTNIELNFSKYEIYGLNPQDFPSVEYKDSDVKISIDKQKMKNIIRHVAFSIGTDDKKITLTGALFDIKDDILKVVSLDGYRLSYRKVNIESTLISESFIIPGKTLNDLSKIIDDEEGNIELCFTGNRVNIKLGNIIMYSNLIDGEFFNYEHIIPTNSDIKVIADTKEMVDSIIRSSLIITPDVKSPLKFDISDNQIYMSSITKNGKAEDTVSCETTGGKLTIGFNHKYLLDAFRACDAKKIKMEFTSSLNPLVIKGVDTDEFIYLILPLRLRNE